MNVLYSPRTPENTVGGWLECVFRPCCMCKKHTKPQSWRIISVLHHGLESQLDYPHGLHIPQPLSLPMHISQVTGMAYNINRRVNLYN